MKARLDAYPNQVSSALENLFKKAGYFNSFMDGYQRRAAELTRKIQVLC